MAQRTSTRGTVIAAVLAVLAVVVGIVVLVQVLGNDEPAGTTGEANAAADLPDVPPGECIEPPPLPKSAQTFAQAPDPATAEDATWRATLHTNCGDVVLELNGDEAPQTVSSFLFLSREGFYRDSACHRLVTSGIHVLQCGDPTGTGSGGPGYGYGIENAPADGVYPRGTLAMARTMDPNTNGSQFFIVFDETHLPVEGGGYSIFGRVVEGMEIVDRIAEAGVGGSIGPEAPAQPISILDVTVEKQT